MWNGQQKLDSNIDNAINVGKNRMETTIKVGQEQTMSRNESREL
jgi:hypothetical protein